MTSSARTNVEDYLHSQLTESVQATRRKSSKWIWILFSIFAVTSIAVILVYYFLYIHNQLVRIDLDYSDREDYIQQDKKITCDCALPIIINPEIITQDQYFLQPSFQICLKRELTGHIPSSLVNGSAFIISYNLLVLPLNINLKESVQNYKNIIISRDGDIMTKIGNITLLRYVNAIQTAILNYFTLFTVNLLEGSSIVAYNVDTATHPDGISDMIMQYDLNDRLQTIITKIIACYDFIDFDIYKPEDFLKDITVEDCYPVNCYLFDKYSSFQGLVLIITFYLAVIGYITMVLQSVYQRITTTSDDAIGEPAIVLQPLPQANPNSGDQQPTVIVQ